MLTATTVVAGAGAAGLRAAEALAERGQDVIVVTDRLKAGTSRNAGSDKQTYYKLTLAGAAGDSVRELAATLFAGGAMDGDTAVAEAAWSARAFSHLVEAGVPFPANDHGEYIGYKTDHDPRQRATSAGPWTSRSMVERLEGRVRRLGVEVVDHCRVVDLIVSGVGDGARAVGLLLLRTEAPVGDASPFLLVRAAQVVQATGGPAGLHGRSAYPRGQWGASGAALRAGVVAQNLTEWQFGLASVAPRWNVSGSYLQALPRIVSTAADGSDEREFVADALGDYGRLVTWTFLKGYQWPFDIRKASDGSSVIDLIVGRELARGRRVWLDFRADPGGRPLDPAALAPEARAYLTAAGALSGRPVERLRRLNQPAYRLYLERAPRTDLAAEPLEVAVGVQHHNGGLAVDDWWQTSLAGLFAVGEAAGCHGVYRPGGAALNSGQVGALRAATRIVADHWAVADEVDFRAAAAPVVTAASDLVAAAAARFATGRAETGAATLAALQQLFDDHVGLVRSAASVGRALDQVTAWDQALAATAVADASSRRSLDRLFLGRDLLLVARVCLTALADYAALGRSRGSALWTDPAGRPPLAGAAGAAWPDEFRFRLDAGALDDRVQQARHDAASGATTLTWRPRRPLPPPDDQFETVWRCHRQAVD
ncbi:MAG: FAD-binding protein [Propionibacteriaceae bacterium]|nr:FAD-binding protein [Propionibacteriaceae bacterium]